MNSRLIPDVLSNIASYIPKDTYQSYCLVSRDFYESSIHNSIQNIDQKLSYYCEKGKIDNARNIFNKSSKRARKLAFRMACINGHLEIVKWLNCEANINIHTSSEYSFRMACINGHLEVAKFLYSIGDVDIHSKNNQAYELSCLYGHLDILKWLHSLDSKYINLNKNQMFINACYNGHLETSKWLYNDIGNIDIHHHDNSAFISSCYNGHLQVTFWLYYILGGIDIKKYYSIISKDACRNGHIHMIKWIYSFGVIDTHKRHCLQQISYENNHYDIVVWLNRIKLMEYEHQNKNDVY